MLVKCNDDDDDIDFVDIECYLLFYYNFIINNDKNENNSLCSYVDK